MSIELFILVFIALVVLSTYLTSVINVEFNINRTSRKRLTSWSVALTISTVLWVICNLYGYVLPLHFSIVAVGLAACSNGYYDLRYTF
jgi:riboflavin transporter FmnP